MTLMAMPSAHGGRAEQCGKCGALWLARDLGGESSCVLCGWVDYSDGQRMTMREEARRRARGTREPYRRYRGDCGGE